MKKYLILLFLLSVCGCQKNFGSNTSSVTTEEMVGLRDIAGILSSARLDREQVQEVYDAVTASAGNGYDEEYTMRNLFADPGSGVGSDKVPASKGDAEKPQYSRPLREVFEDYYSLGSKGGGGLTAQEYLNYIKNSDMEIYWPYSEDWDGVQMPVITFDPESDRSSNIGFLLEDGEIREVTVDEEFARTHPVWVINRNSDAGYTSLEVYRKNNPDWASGGAIHIGGKSSANPSTASKAVSDPSMKTLVLKTMTAMRNYDNWFAGAAEFWLKIGSVESFKASTEAELKLYNPAITDFMVVVRRKQVGQPLNLNTVLVSEWTSQLENCALMLIEDDGGTITNWNCSAVVKCNSKSYGFELSIPYRSHDDIVWRGQLSRRYIERTSDVSGNFGDVQLTFSILDL